MKNKLVHKKIIVPHEDFLDFMDAMTELRPNVLDQIMVSGEIMSKLTSGGKWQHRNHIGEGKPILEFEWWGNNWYQVTEFRGINRNTSAYTEKDKVYWVQFDNEDQVEITCE